MSATDVFLVVAIAWLLVGSLLAFFMARRGHSTFTWWLVGVLLGPLAVPVAVATVRRPPGRDRVVRPGVPGAGSVDLLVGIDGSPEAEAALRAAIALLGGRLRRVTLATVIGAEAAAATRPWPSEERARAHLAELAELVPDLEPQIVLLAGRPADALRRKAAEEGDDLLAIGARGHGATTKLLGSVATRLARGPGVPVLVVGAGGSDPSAPGGPEGPA